ncbi:hypothetical protein [Candidatus Contendibacter odensensis]|jgi:hypothetical protein|uniref:Uncharacterized protein n=1 Tax=Candidatus Contendobacter odensis Run_B_J11 TaxID=1400861 RepID=A0A7U7J409_9GAMM|nr:hypothetical protein [Candidatus Contendobacter odensis]MBK8752281.1 hypothetical protein [Candidatus Competibacteraceae bacterium]CDH44745.1 hypothetical protein BN874_1860009 [Candidatus Contendobacter odensis Run_B_J11]
MNSEQWGLLPPANDEQRKDGWILSPAFLIKIRDAARAYGERVSIEQVEAVLLGTRAHLLLIESETKGIQP